MRVIQRENVLNIQCTNVVQWENVASCSKQVIQRKKVLSNRKTCKYALLSEKRGNVIQHKKVLLSVKMRYLLPKRSIQNQKIVIKRKNVSSGTKNELSNAKTIYTPSKTIYPTQKHVISIENILLCTENVLSNNQAYYISGQWYDGD